MKYGRQDVLDAAREIARDMKPPPERLRIFTKLFSMFPIAGQLNIKATMAAYIEETKDIHELVLSHALRKLVDQKDRKWVPQTNEIKRKAAEIIRAAQPRSPKAFALGYNPWVPEPAEVDVDKWLQPQQQFWALPEGKARETLKLVDRLEKRMKVKA